MMSVSSVDIVFECDVCVYLKVSYMYFYECGYCVCVCLLLYAKNRAVGIC